jgi:hypothetical protein
MAIKIPTYTAKGRPTTDGPGVTSNIQISPTGGTAARILPAANQIAEFTLQKRDLSEKIQSQKIVNGIKGELDKVIVQQKDNIDEDNAIINLNKSYKSTTESQLSGITNKRIKERVKNLLDLEHSGYVNKIKKNSYVALEKETEKTTNETLTAISSEYFQSDAGEKTKVRDKGINTINTLAQTLKYPPNKLKEKLEAFDRSLLFSDFTAIAGTENAVEDIISRDNDFGGDKTTTNEEFSAGVLNAYSSKINEITVKGDPDADFDKAKDMIEELKTLQRSNGFKLDQGVISDKIAKLEEKIRVDEISHQNILDKTKMGFELTEYADEQKKGVSSAFYNSLDPTMNKATSKDLATEATAEYDVRLDAYIKSNPDASLFEKKQYARDLKLLLIDKYQETTIEQVSTFNLEQNKFNVVRTEQEITSARTKFLENPTQPNILKTLAKLNGYVDKDKNPDVNAFLNDYVKILEARKKD